MFVEQPLAFPWSPKSELLKAATMRPHSRAKVFRDCARLGFWNAKMHNFPLFHLFWVSFQFLCWFLGHLVCAKILNGNIGHAKKFAFRRSALNMVQRLFTATLQHCIIIGWWADQNKYFFTQQCF